MSSKKEKSLLDKLVDIASEDIKGSLMDAHQYGYDEGVQSRDEEMQELKSENAELKGKIAEIKRLMGVV